MFEVPNSIPVHGQFIDSSQLKSQGYLDQLNQWSENKKMIMNQKKSNAMDLNWFKTYNLQVDFNEKKKM